MDFNFISISAMNFKALTLHYNPAYVRSHVTDLHLDVTHLGFLVILVEFNQRYRWQLFGYKMKEAGGQIH